MSQALLLATSVRIGLANLFKVKQRLVSQALLLATRLRFRRPSLFTVKQAKEPVAKRKSSRKTESTQPVVVSPSIFTVLGAPKELPGKDGAILKQAGLTMEPDLVVPVLTSNADGIQEILETPAANSISHSSEAETLIVENPLSSTLIQFETIDVEVKKLLAGREYDANVIDAKDSATRQIISAALLSALAGRNNDQHQAARQGFLEHGYFDEATRDLRTAESPVERAAAARQLGLIGHSLATAHLVGALYDSAPEVRNSAVESLGQIGDPAAISALDDLLLRETSSQLPEAVIRHAINSIPVLEIAPPPVIEEDFSLPIGEQPAEEPKAHEQMCEEFIEYLDSLKLREFESDSAALTSSSALAPSVSPGATEDDLALDEEQLRLEEETLRRAAAELEDRRLEAEAARRRAEEEGWARAESQAQARAEAEARLSDMQAQAPKLKPESASKRKLVDERNEKQQPFGPKKKPD